MRKAALASATVIVSMCLGLPPQKASTQVSLSSSQSVPKITTEYSGPLNPHNAKLVMRERTTQVGATADRGPVTTDTNDSDEFLQRTIRSAPPSRDHSQKIEALLKRMTIEEKVGQMTQLAINMVTTGQGQDIRIDPAKLEKAMVRYGVNAFMIFKLANAFGVNQNQTGAKMRLQSFEEFIATRNVKDAL